MENCVVHEINSNVEVEIHDEDIDEQEDIVVPAVGMVFKSDEEVKDFYKAYAISMGFSFKIRNSKRRRDGSVGYLLLSCSREGDRPSTLPSSMKTLPTIHANCEAKITATKTRDNLWHIYKVVLEHNHDLSPTKSRLFKMNKKLSLHAKRTIELNDISGVRISKTFHTLVEESGGFENLCYGEKDVRNYINRERRSIGKNGDAKALLAYFCKMQAQNQNFFYELDLDDDFHVRNIFWADGRSRAAYESFGDIVSFDTTYLTNRYEMPFAAFVGVNHHGQSVLLGCGLLSSEETDSFVWLFESWIKCMGGKTPSGVVTDQCRAMEKALQIVMPNTRHRWCLWHIMKKIPEKLRGYVEYKNIKTVMKDIVYESLTEEEFEEKWGCFVKGFSLENNVWLGGLFSERHKWVPIYLKKDFWAGLSTTQRSESIHAFFDGYVNSTTTLQQFVVQYGNALKSRAEKEIQADFQSMNTIIRCGSSSPIEKQFQEHYTHAKFSEVQEEFRGKMNCVPHMTSVEGVVVCFDVFEERIVFGRPKDITFVVALNRETCDVKCQCMLFEFRGIVCRHSLCVMTFERIKQVPEKYILCRWSKLIKRKHSHIKVGCDATEMKPNMERFDKMLKHFNDVAEFAADSEEASNLVHATIDKLYVDL